MKMPSDSFLKLPKHTFSKSACTHKS